MNQIKLYFRPFNARGLKFSNQNLIIIFGRRGKKLRLSFFRKWRRGWPARESLIQSAQNLCKYFYNCGDEFATSKDKKKGLLMTRKESVRFAFGLDNNIQTGKKARGCSQLALVWSTCKDKHSEVVVLCTFTDEWDFRGLRLRYHSSIGVHLKLAGFAKPR